MELLSETIDGELPDLAKQGVRTRFLGRRDRLDALARRRRCAALEEETAAPRHAPPLDRVRLRRPRGARRGRATARRGRRRSRRRSTRQAVAARLYAPEIGEIDLLVRTSGELRLSNFLLWEAAYAELVFTDTLWPDFGEDDLRAAVDAYAARQRRFGARAAT